MTSIRKIALLLPLFMISIAGLAQTTPPPATTSETGAVNFYADAGWSFGVPANRASAFAQAGNTTFGPVSSPEKNTLVAPSFGVMVTAWKFVAPFIDFTAYDNGTATASIGSLVSAKGEGSSISFNGGVRFVGGKSRFRPYAEVGGGAFHQDLTATIIALGQTTTEKLSTTLGEAMYGGGIQLFAGHKWGSDIGVDGFHVTQALSNGKSNYARIRFGIFYQTKSSIQ